MIHIEKLCAEIGYHFHNPELLSEALTHRSAGKCNNERMEFLGDSILNFVITDVLYKKYPDFNEGELSRLRASLVKGDRLAVIAAGVNLGEYLALGSGELKSGGFRRKSILADAFEAVLGAVFLDGGYEPCRQVILGLYREPLAAISSVDELKDPKTRLQEWLQSRRQPLPEYEVEAVSGEAHRQSFRVSCHIAFCDLTVFGEGKSRRKAEQVAAEMALASLQQ